jgi:hypothetical protein
MGARMNVEQPSAASVDANDRHDAEHPPDRSPDRSGHDQGSAPAGEGGDRTRSRAEYAASLRASGWQDQPPPWREVGSGTQQAGHAEVTGRWGQVTREDYAVRMRAHDAGLASRTGADHTGPQIQEAAESGPVSGQNASRVGDQEVGVPRPLDYGPASVFLWSESSQSHQVVAENRDYRPAGRLGPEKVYVDGREVDATHVPADGTWVEGLPGDMPGTPVDDPYGTAKIGEFLAAGGAEQERSRLERADRVLVERFDDISDDAEHYAEEMQELFDKEPPPTSSATRAPSPEITQGGTGYAANAGQAVDATLAIAAVSVAVVQKVHEAWPTGRDLLHEWHGKWLELSEHWRLGRSSR